MYLNEGDSFFVAISAVNEQGESKTSNVERLTIHNLQTLGLGLVFDSMPDIEVKNPTAQLGLDHCALSKFHGLAVLDMNMDGNKDILVTLLCGTVDQLPEWSDPNTQHYDPVPNALVAIASQSDSTYKVDDEKIFGKNNDVRQR